MPRKRSQEEVLARFREVHGGRYDYGAVIYIGSHKKVTVTCNVHGDFQIMPGHHARGVGCRHCYFQAAKIGLEEFIARSLAFHSDRYDYELVHRDVGSGDSVRIRCREHSEVFAQNAGAHMRGHTSCRSCLSAMLSGPAHARGSKKTASVVLQS